MVASSAAEWLGSESAVAQAVEQRSSDCLNTYRVDRRRVAEDANLERSAIEGGYARRQLFELVQNGADELIDSSGRIEVVLTPDAMYCANEGRPVSAAGVGALLGAHNSAKHGAEIGRFGLGFKSVLGITTKPAVYSVSGSFKFDREYNLTRIRKVVPDAERVSTLRIARPVEPRRAAAEDPILAELMDWATTVIVMPRDIDSHDWLSASLAAFPAQFLLFSKHVTSLTLDDRGPGGTKRVVTLDGGDDDFRLDPGTGQPVRWRIFSTTFEPTGRSLTDGGTLASRGKVPVHWAVPTDGAAARRTGEMWAFFPTRETTTLSGILNAPWKLNEDRTGLVEGPYNESLLRTVVEVFMSSLEQVSDPEDPGFVIDLLPGRGRETRGWADEVLSKAVYAEAATRPCLPDQTGALREPAALHPIPEGVPLAAAQLWARQPTRPRDWIHPSALRDATRRSRAERLISAAVGPTADVAEWLTALIPGPGHIRGAAAAIRVAAGLAHSASNTDVRAARIVVTADGRMVAANRGSVYLPAETAIDLDVPIVHPDLLAEDGVEDALHRLGVQVVSPSTVLDALLDRSTRPGHTNDWTEIWTIARDVPVNEIRRLVLDQHGFDAADVSVRSFDGRWQPLADAILAGDLLAEKDFRPDCRGSLIDTSFHRRELGLFAELGATDRPTVRDGFRSDPWITALEGRLAESAVADARRHGADVSPRDFELEPSGPIIGPLAALDALTPEAAARYGRELLRVAHEFPRWQLRSKKRRSQAIDVENPLISRIREQGLLPTDRGPAPLELCVSPAIQKPFAELLPVPDIPKAAITALGLPVRPSELDDRRVNAAFAAVTRIDNEARIGPAYAALAELGCSPPETLRAVVRRSIASVARERVCAAVTLDDVKALRGTGEPFIRVDDADTADKLVESWGLRSVRDVISKQLFPSPMAPAEAVADRFPLLVDVLGPAVRDLVLVDCAELREETYTDSGSLTSNLRFAVRDATVYRTAEIDDESLLRELGARYDVPIDHTAARDIIENAQSTKVRAWLASVREEATEEAKLLALLGVEEVRSRIPSDVLDAVETIDGDLDDLGTARLALSVFGVEVLRHFAEALKTKGLSPPPTWAGGRATQAFVADLGFDRKYAGFAGMSLEQVIDVPGPSSLPELHDFQRRSANEVRALIAGDGGMRGLLSLPTGAGKTRVAVQAIIESMVAGEVVGPVLWIAQSEELCEQAVGSWAEVWRAHGTEDPLRISRLWTTHTAAAREDDGPQVVVATVQKLTASCTDDRAYDWLAIAGCVVIDEAHTSTGTSYTQTLNWLGMGGGKTRAPLIGLSATPFRGVSQEATTALVNRYGRRRLDRNAFDEEISIPLLQRRRILAEVDHQILEGSESVPLSTEEKAEIKKMRRLPATVLNKIGSDVDRTVRVVDAVMNQDRDWPVLIFAASVAHARTLAALLERQGRSAAAISGETPTPVRRHLINEFREGRLKTLTNYGVLTQGFDAPSVRALFIARPTYSPNLYQQMVGRGLRGPENGGKDRCLVVDVADNIMEHGFDLAFREFEYLWTE